MKPLCRVLACLMFPVLAAWSGPVRAQPGSSADLAQQLSNPVASLISVPFQFNYDEGLGASGDGSRFTTNFQPVVPISLTPSWNLISRTIVPFTYQEDIVPGTSQSGVGDIVQSFFFSPVEPTAGGLIWGLGPVFLLPTSSEVSADQFGAGVTGVALKQSGPWTFGALANHIWDVGDDDGTDISNTFLQPFLSYTTPEAWTFTVNSESTYDWLTEEASVPVNLMVTKLTHIGQRPVSIGGGLRYWVDTPQGGPEGLGFRFVVTFLYPR